MTGTPVDQLRADLRLAQRSAHEADAARAESEARLLQSQAVTLEAQAREARVHAEAVVAHATVAEVRRLCDLTINASVRVQAVEQARDTLAAIDAVAEGETLPGDDAWGAVWLHTDWRYLTKQMPTSEKEYAADAVARWMAKLDEADGEVRCEPEGLRWWRD